ncbi:divalent anion:Na+ symporter, DASS family [Actinomyces ruminicola]|uniref:Divalent anion:Na+ symporter, DASS family n=1 Tax=Actinomyces ruminicola TaxID=332524 RepID=A0A1H0CJ38_9ACTO|nr:DASS family sodium-coupled anion symporter [Actinomyces ruminicola]SDN57928.1 divalent anion:Na+ symporter, DASS family [Actinomyces ruminicola]
MSAADDVRPPSKGAPPIRTGFGRETRPVPLAVSLAVGLGLWLIPTPSGLESAAWHLFAIFLATIIGIILKAAPMGALSIIAMAVCAATGVLAPDGDSGDRIGAALSGFSNSTIWLIVSAFFAARAVIASGLGERLAYLFVRVFGRSTLGLAYGLGLADLVTSPAIPSNTARSGYVYPVMMSVARAFGSEPGDKSSHHRLGSYLALTTYNLNLAVSVIFFTGAAPNAMSSRLAESAGVTVNWPGWFMAAVVPGLIGVIVVPLVIYALNRPEIRRTPDAADMAARELRRLGPVTHHEWVTLGVFIGMIALWVIGDSFMSATTVALLGLGALLLSGALTWEQMKAERSAWDTLTWFAALVMMGTYLNELGFIGWLGDHVGTMMGGLGKFAAFAALTGVYALTHYLFASGTAHTASMFSVFLGVGLALGLPGMPLTVFLGAIPTLMGCLTHYGNGPAPLYFGSGFVELGTWWRTGLVVGVVHLVIWLVVGPLWWNVIGVW